MGVTPAHWPPTIRLQLCLRFRARAPQPAPVCTMSKRAVHDSELACVLSPPCPWPAPLQRRLELRVKRLSEDATLPVRGSPGAAGYDLFAAVPVTIAAQGKALVPTDIAVAIPAGYYGRVAPRSSLGWKAHVDVGAGVIDADYRGAVGIVLYNFGASEFKSASHNSPRAAYNRSCQG